MSYHNIVVIVNEEKYDMAKEPKYELIYTSMGGWCLWYNWAGSNRVVGSEFGENVFKILVNDVEICNNAKTGE